MPAPRVDIISIGTLSRNLQWNETAALRTPHATTSLIRAGSRKILVDPGLPSAALGARLFERTGLRPEAIDIVFLTNFRPAHRGGLELFSNAKVLIHEIEQRTVSDHLRRLLQSASDEGQKADAHASAIRSELALLESLSPADDKIADGVDLFPLPGYTPGTCGLLVAAPVTTTLIAGDAVPTLDHFLAMQVLPDSIDIEQAQESMREVYEIADLVVPGHDNVFVNPRTQGA